jgi:hypothetical protein
MQQGAIVLVVITLLVEELDVNKGLVLYSHSRTDTQQPTTKFSKILYDEDQSGN